jgi:hypothetical protein
MESETASYAVDRELVRTDLDRIASNLSPRIASRLASLTESMLLELETSGALTVRVLGLAVNAGPMVTKLIRTRLGPAWPPRPESVAPLLSSALLQLLELSDAELATLCEAVGTELGAWARLTEPVDPDRLAAALAPLDAFVVGADG